MPPLARSIRLLPCLASALVLSTVGAWPGPSCQADDKAIRIAPEPEVIDEQPTFPPAAPPFPVEAIPADEWPAAAPPVIAPPSAIIPPSAVAPPAARVRWDAAPPPGTLGRTYKQPSALIPKDEHPRTARIDVAITTLPFVEVLGLEDFDGFRGRDGLWHFKSKRPLLPGVPHIYQVIAHDGTPGGVEDVRTVRMIPGRIVRVAF
jgi:hypothetical protein